MRLSISTCLPLVLRVYFYSDPKLGGRQSSRRARRPLICGDPGLPAGQSGALGTFGLVQVFRIRAFWGQLVSRYEDFSQRSNITGNHRLTHLHGLHDRLLTETENSSSAAIYRVART